MNRALKEQNSDSWINGRRRDHGKLINIYVYIYFYTTGIAYEFMCMCPYMYIYICIHIYNAIFLWSL
jgi:hypothetical protein